MQIIHSITQWQTLFHNLYLQQKSVGLVATMGALHLGHISLVEASKEHDDEITAATIFVNPTQFNNPEDLEKYPSTWDADIKMLEEAGVDYLFAPNYEDLYPDNYRYKLTELEFSQDLCGTARPGHFDGVLTVVMKLLQLTKPRRAYFGKKDLQQYQLVRDMAQSFFIDTEIVGCPLIRETSGLAMSSRNKRLSRAQRHSAANVYATIKQAVDIEQMHEQLVGHGFTVDYLKEIDGRIFVAVFLGEVRLIDNVPWALQANTKE